MLGRVILLSLVGLAACSHELPKNIMQMLNKWNLEEKCFGIENMIPFTLKLHQAGEHCKQLHPRVSGGFMTLPQPINQNPWQTLPQAVNRNPWTKPAPQGSDSEILSKLAQLLLPNIRQQLRRNKRDAGGLLQADETDFQEFLDNFDDFKMGMMSKISNLTCVLTQMDMMDSNMQPNLYTYTTSFWEHLDYSDPETAIVDPEWKQKMINSYNDCHDVAQAWPQKSLDRNEITKRFGRQMVFFKCAKKMEMVNCAKHQILKALELWYGENDGMDLSQYGLPRDKYDAAALSMMVMYESATDEEEFVNDFFWSNDM